jgi:hypothetical protein
VQSIVGRFKDKISVWEFFNEPNDWAGGSSSQGERIELFNFNSDTLLLCNVLAEGL